MYWLIALGLSAVSVAYHSMSQRGPEESWIIRARLQWPLRLFLIAVIGVIVSLAVALMANSFFYVPMLGEASDSPWDTMGAAFALAMAAVLGLSVLKYSDLVVTPTALHVFHIAIPWSAVTMVGTSGSGLAVWTPHHRRSWNGWTGKTLLPMWLWSNTTDLSSTIHRMFEARGPESEAG